MLRTTLLKGILALAATAGLASAAFAQAVPAAIEAPVEITFYNYNLATAGLGAEATRKLIAEFEAANPLIKVNGVGVADIAGRIQADLAAGRGPDVAQVVFDDLGFTVENLGAQALEDVVPADEMAAHFEGMVPNGLKLGVLDGKTYALAYTFSTPVLFYNADLFRQAGLDPDAPPRNWDEVLAAGVAIRETTGAPSFEAMVFAGGDDDWLLQGILRSNGGRTLSEDRRTLSFAEPAAIEAVSMLRGLNDAGLYENNTYQTALENMAAGGVGMFLSTSALQSALISGAEGNYELRATTMPGFGETPAVPTNSGSGLVILTADPVKQRAAWEFMKFMTSERGYTVITSEIGYVPLRPEIVNDPQYLGEWIKDHPLVQPNLDQLSRLEPWVPYPGPSYRQINTTMMDAMEMAIFGDVDVAETLKAAQEQAQGLMPN